MTKGLDQHQSRRCSHAPGLCQSQSPCVSTPLFVIGICARCASFRFLLCLPTSPAYLACLPSCLPSWVTYLTYLPCSPTWITYLTSLPFSPPAYLTYLIYLTYLALIPSFGDCLGLHALKSCVLMSTPGLPYPLTGLVPDKWLNLPYLPCLLKLRYLAPFFINYLKILCNNVYTFTFNTFN